MFPHPAAAAVLMALALLFMPRALGQSDSNPLLTTWADPSAFAPLDTVRPEHFPPAYAQAIQIENQEVGAILDNPEVPTFANTIAPLARAGSLRARIELLLENLQTLTPSPTLREAEDALRPMQIAQDARITSHPRLVARVGAVWDQRKQLKLEPAQLRLLEKIHADLELRPGPNADRITAITEVISRLTEDFGRNVTELLQKPAVTTSSEDDLEGLSPAVRSAAARLANNAGHPDAFAFNLQQGGLLPVARNRGFRQRVYEAEQAICSTPQGQANNAIASRIAALRVELAKLYGYPTFGDYALRQNMLVSPAKVLAALEPIWPAAKAHVETREKVAALLAARQGIELKPWDVEYYLRELREQEQGFSEEEASRYFPLEGVRAGAFMLARRLWGLSFIERTDIPKYAPEVKTYEVTDRDGTRLGYFYVDDYVRPGKRTGAWTNAFRDQEVLAGVHVTPLVINAFNFVPPEGSQPKLLRPSEARVLFHEFGHAVHILVTKVDHRLQVPWRMPIDFVELSSQMMEQWAFHPEVLPLYARHYRSGEPLPAHWVGAIATTANAARSAEVAEYLAATFLDLAWHSATDPTPRDALSVEAELMDRLKVNDTSSFRYPTCIFRHVFGSRYSAQYYSYVWSWILAADGFHVFASDPFNAAEAERYRTMILEKGDSEPPSSLYGSFRGAEPNVDVFLANHGLERR